MFGLSPSKSVTSPTSLIGRLGVAWLVCWSLLGSGLILGSVTSYAHADRVQTGSVSLRGMDPGEQVAMSDSGRLPMKNIEDIVPGDIVMAEDETTGELAPKRVVRVFHNVTDHLRIVGIRSSDGIDQELQTTDEHPFYVESLGWVAAKNLSAGQSLVERNGRGSFVVSSVYEPHPEGVPVFNFEVEDFHTYFVSQSDVVASILVHNKCGPSIASQRRAAVRNAWRDEKALVSSGGGQTRNWTARQRRELLTTGKVKGIEGHHINSVNGHPRLAGDPNNIEFVTRAENLQRHGGNFRNPTSGPLVSR